MRSLSAPAQGLQQHRTAPHPSPTLNLGQSLFSAPRDSPRSQTVLEGPPILSLGQVAGEPGFTPDLRPLRRALPEGSSSGVE